MGWVTQMEHYFSLHGISDELESLCYVVIYMYPKYLQWWKWHKNAHQRYVSWTHFVAQLYECFNNNTHYLCCLTKLK